MALEANAPPALALANRRMPGHRGPSCAGADACRTPTGRLPCCRLREAFRSASLSITPLPLSLASRRTPLLRSAPKRGHLGSAPRECGRFGLLSGSRKTSDPAQGRVARCSQSWTCLRSMPPTSWGGAAACTPNYQVLGRVQDGPPKGFVAHPAHRGSAVSPHGRQCAAW